MLNGIIGSVDNGPRIFLNVMLRFYFVNAVANWLEISRYLPSEAQGTARVFT
jgi:hypothetical protein